MTTHCQNCQSAHPTQQCPEITALLFAPARYRCDGCGNPTDALGLCHVCQEDECSAIIAGMVRDSWGVSLELRASIRATAAERVEFAPF
jgi:hypothetical protein